MEFIANPTKQQLAVIEHGLDEYNAGVASARSVTRVARSASNPATSWLGWKVRRTGGSSTSGSCGYIRITNPKVSAAA